MPGADAAIFPGEALGKIIIEKDRNLSLPSREEVVSPSKRAGDSERKTALKKLTPPDQSVHRELDASVNTPLL